jgi:hypothetical protein
MKFTSMPSAVQMMSLYLYGQVNAPRGDQLLSDQWIRPAKDTTPIEIDAAWYMQFGAGRFATPDKFAVVQNFFAGNDSLKAGTYSLG